MMFKKIIVPLDGTPQANAVLPLARTFAQATGAQLRLLPVTSEVEPPEDITARGAWHTSSLHQTRM